MFEQASSDVPRNVAADWAIRGGIAVAFMIFGAEKFPSDGGSSWVKLFHEIGVGLGTTCVYHGIRGPHPHICARPTRRQHYIRRFFSRTGCLLLEPAEPLTCPLDGTPLAASAANAFR
jgi:hypothetical protein